MIFDDQTKGQETNQQQQTQTTEDWLAKVVEAKGENFRDIQTLAKSKLESDNYIKELERQLKEMRDDQSKDEYSKKLLEVLQNKGSNFTNDNPAKPKDTGNANQDDTKPLISEDVVKTLVEQHLTEREKTNTVKQNISTVEKTLEERYGTQAKETVEKKAAELGMSMGRMMELAGESPTAFLTLIGEAKKNSNPIVNGTINTQSVGNTNPQERNWAWYQKLRRENKALYYRPETQQQLFQDKMRLGPQFGN